MENSQRQIFKHQIELLESQIEEQRKRQGVLRRLNETLEEQFQAVVAEKDQYEELNDQLGDRIKQLRERHCEELSYYEQENLRLNGELNEKTQQEERKGVDSQRREVLLEQKITMLESIIEKKCNRVGDLQKKLHDQSICGFKDNSRLSSVQLPNSHKADRNGELAVSAIQYSQCETENNMKYSNLFTSRQSKVSDLMKLDKPELKVMMGALIKSRRHLEQGTLDSLYGHTTKRNQTFCQ